MKYIIILVCLLLNNYSFNNNKSLSLFQGEILVKEWSGETINYEQETSKIIGKAITHLLIPIKTNRFQIKDDFVVESSVDHLDSEVKNAFIQKKNHQKLFLSAPPNSIDSATLNIFFKSGGMYPYKYKIPESRLKRSKDKKYILGLDCTKYSEEVKNKYSGKEYKIEYWIQENLKFQQYEFDGSYGKVFKREGLVLETITLLKPELDTMSRTTTIQLNINNSTDNPFDRK